MLFLELFHCIQNLLPTSFHSQVFNHLQIDSRLVQKNDLFIAQSGYTHNSHQFILEVLEKGAFVIKDNKETLIDIPKQYLPFIISVPSTKEILPILSKTFFGSPDESMTIIGITGTNGKTSTTSIIHNLLTKLDQKTGLIGTIENKIASISLKSINTTPNAFSLYELLATMKKEGCTTVVMEISSHALATNRTGNLALDIALFTNLSPEHLDFHHNMQEYLETKLSIFNLLEKSPKQNKLAIYNSLTPVSRAIQEKIKSLNLTYQNFAVYETTDFVNMEHTDNSFFARIIRSNIKETEFEFYHKNQLLGKIQTSLQGIFGVENLMAALLCQQHLHIKLEDIIPEVLQIQVKGRFENITQNYPYSIIIDYAHSPDALESILKTARKLNPNKILVIFGCGGDRDKTKRPVMGAIAANLADTVIITSDNPRSESPINIMEEIKQGIKTNKEVLMIVNRQKAIKKGLSLIENGDMMIIAGKGHENYQIFKYKTIHFSDHETVHNLLKG